MVDSCLAVGPEILQPLMEELICDLHQIHVSVLFLWPGRFGDRESQCNPTLLGATM